MKRKARLTAGVQSRQGTRQDYPETDAPMSGAALGVSPHGRSTTRACFTPVPAPDYESRAGIWTLIIVHHAPSRIRRKRVHAPLPDIAMHIVKPPYVWGLQTDAVRAPARAAIPGEAAKHGVGWIVPKVKSIRGAGAAGIFPLRLGRQQVNVAGSLPAKRS